MGKVLSQSNWPKWIVASARRLGSAGRTRPSERPYRLQELPRNWRYTLMREAATIRRSILGRVTFVGVTGSVGKSTTVALSGSILSCLGNCHAQPGTVPGLVAKSLWQLKSSTRFHLQEVHASFPGLIAEHVKLLRPQIGVVTAIGGDHMKSYASLEEKAREKGLLVESLPESGVAILNADDPLVLRMAERARARVITFGCDKGADIRATQIFAAWPDRLSLTVEHKGQSVRVETKLVGAHWVMSVLAAIATGVACGVDLIRCANALREVEPLFGRYSAHIRPDGAAYVLDTHKAPFWTIPAGLAFVRDARAVRKTMIFGTITDYPDSSRAHYRRVAQEALEVADRVMFVGPQADYVRPLRKGELSDRLLTHRTAYEATAFLHERMEPGDLIYVKASASTSHLERIMLADLDNVVCWLERCEKNKFCTRCGRYRRAAPPPELQAEAAEAALG